MKDMLAKSINQFTDSLESLRYFIDLVDKLLAGAHKDLMVSKKQYAATLLLLLNSLDLPKNPNIKTIPLDTLKKDVPDDVHLEFDDSGKQAIHIKANPEFDQGFIPAIKEFLFASKQHHHLYKSSVVSLTSSTELFLSTFLHVYFEKYPDAIGSKEKLLSINDLIAFHSVQDARDHLIAQKIDGLVREGFRDWIRFLKEKVKLSMGYIEEDVSRLEEIFLRRNLIVHNDSVINSIYMTKVSPEISNSVKIGESLETDKQYVQGAIDMLEKSFLLISAELWKKLDPLDDQRATTLSTIASGQLKASRWPVAQGIFCFIMNDKKLAEKHQIQGKLNYWYCIKKQGKLEDIRPDVEKMDFSAKAPFFRLQAHCLTDSKRDFFELLPGLLETNDFSIVQLNDWPIFDGMRSDPAFEPYLLASSDSE